MNAITVDEVYNQAKKLPAAEQKQLFSRLLEDIAPEPPNTFHSEDELEQMLLAGLNSGPGIPVTPEYWQQKKERLTKRFGPQTPAKRATRSLPIPMPTGILTKPPPTSPFAI